MALGYLTVMPIAPGLKEIIVTIVMRELTSLLAHSCVPTAYRRTASCQGGHVWHIRYIRSARLVPIE